MALGDIHSAALTKLSIASTSGVATQDLAGFTAKTYVEVGEVTSIGDFGAKFNVINHNPLANPVTQKFKGSKDNGKGSFEFANKTTDAGQIAMKAASNTYSAYAIKVEEQDGSVTYFLALITGFSKKIGTIDNIVAISADFEITSALIEA